MLDRIKEVSPIAFDVAKNSLEAGAVMGSIGGILFQNVTGVFSGAILGFGFGAIYNAAKNINQEATIINCATSPFFTYSANLVAKEILPNSIIGQIARFTIVTSLSVGAGIYASQRYDPKLQLQDILRIATANAIIHTVVATLPSVAAALPRLGHQ